MSQPTAQYVDKKTVNESYRPKAGLMSPGLKRAREPYRIRNALTGIVLGAFAVGIWAYSISAVKQDVFDDVDEEAKAIARKGTAAEVLSVKDEKKAMEAAISAASSTYGGVVASPDSTPSSQPTSPAGIPALTPRRGVLQHLDNRFPWLLDPQRKTLVWGAPPVDDIGKMWKS